jgi:hypothetical protein
MIPVLGGAEEGGISWVDEADVQARASHFHCSPEPTRGRVLSRARPAFPPAPRTAAWLAHYLNAFLAAVAAR